MKWISRRIGRTLAMMGIGASALWFGLAGGQAAFAAQAPARSIGSPVSADSIAQASTEQVTPGCALLTLTNLTVGMKVGDYVSQNVQPASAVISVWHFDNTSHQYQANYFSDPSVPVDQPTFTTPIDAFFFCFNANATAP